MSEKRIEINVELSADVYVIIDEERAPYNLFTRAEDVENFQNHLYGPSVSDKATVLEHWSHNAIFNRVDDASRLDGWGDLERGIVTFHVGPGDISDVMVTES